MAQSESGQTNSALQRVKKFHLSDQRKCRMALQTLLNEYRADDSADTARFRAMCYCIKTISEILRDSDFEARIERLEEFIKSKGIVL